TPHERKHPSTRPTSTAGPSARTTCRGRRRARSSGMTVPAVEIVGMRPEHWPDVARIYAQGVATGNATFETEVPSWEQWNRNHMSCHRFVAMRGGAVVGWVAVSAVSERCVYAGVVENSVYVAEEARGQGVGRLLLDGLAASTEAAGIWTIQTGIFPEN